MINEMVNPRAILDGFKEISKSEKELTSSVPEKMMRSPNAPPIRLRTTDSIKNCSKIK
jgi:hypothetical protein